MNLYITALISYSAFLMTLGVIVSRRVKTAADFLVAGRRLGPGRVFASFLAANIGAASTVGATGLGYRYGLSAWWWVGSAGIGTFLLSQFVGPQLWTLAKAHGFATLPDYLEYRYGRTIKAVIAVLFWAGALTILAGQLIAISWILYTVGGVPKWEGCIIGGGVAIVYCTAGGLVSSSFVNIFELAATMSGLLLAVPFAIHALGGWAHLQLIVNAQTESVAKANSMFSMVGVGPKQILAWVAILVPSFIVSPGLVQKLYGAHSERSVRVGIGFNALGQLIFAFVPAVLGLCALAALPHLANPELALPAAMKLLLPKWLGVWTLAAIFSAELSATDAILFMLSASLTVDLYKTFLNPNVSEEKLLTASRIASVGAGLMGVSLAILMPSVIAAVSIFYGLIAVALFVPVIAGLYSNHVLWPAALSSILSALTATLICIYFTNGRGWYLFSPQAIGWITAAIVMLAFRLLYPQRFEPNNNFVGGTETSWQAEQGNRIGKK